VKQKNKRTKKFKGVSKHAASKHVKLTNKLRGKGQLR